MKAQHELAEGSKSTSVGKLSIDKQASLVVPLYREINAKLVSSNENDKRLGVLLAFKALSCLQADPAAITTLSNLFTIKDGYAILNSMTITDDLVGKIKGNTKCEPNMLCWITSGKLSYSKAGGFVKTLQPSLDKNEQFGSISMGGIPDEISQETLAQIPEPTACLFFAKNTSSSLSAPLLDFKASDADDDLEDPELARNNDLDDLL